MTDFLLKVDGQIVNPVIYFMMGLALVYFLWGVAEYIMKANEPEGRETGTRHIIWGIVGLLIMFGVFGIAHIILNSIGVGSGNTDINTIIK